MAEIVRDNGPRERLQLHTASAHECAALQDKTVGTAHTRIGPFRVDFRLTERQVNLLHELRTFYTSENVRLLLVPLVQQETSLSLRALDWLVTNYAKRHNVVCATLKGESFNIHQGYRATLGVNKRRNFDPFRRRMRLQVDLDHDQSVESTVGQVNFLHWAHVNGVLRFLRENIAAIEAEMNETTRASRLRRRRGVVQKRHELTKAPPSRCMIYDRHCQISFS